MRRASGDQTEAHNVALAPSDATRCLGAPPVTGRVHSPFASVQAIVAPSGDHAAPVARSITRRGVPPRAGTSYAEPPARKSRRAPSGDHRGQLCAVLSAGT